VEPKKNKGGRPSKPKAEKLANRKRKDKAYRQRQQLKKTMDPAKKLPRGCVEIKGEQRDSKKPGYTVPLLVRVRKLDVKDTATEAELAHMYEDFASKHYDFSRKAMKAGKTMLASFIRKQEKLLRRIYKVEGVLDQYEAYEAAIMQQDGEEDGMKNKEK